ncbi:BTB/POZ domain-containing protein 2-like [Gigantopelta aegis]|uniref:BTB/POZ domain-containing protein 2-like n=1 Tax=Gigantopelta aegis TaxID=1735272 RepID=UPI001B88A419|nr:BTB/POZ domain-containing protein 2-like [Gigantopelta aegis]
MTSQQKKGKSPRREKTYLTVNDDWETRKSSVETNLYLGINDDWQTPKSFAETNLYLGINDDWQTRKSLAETNLYMLENKIACDITFRVGPTREKIQAHKFMLISRSHVFAAMFTGPMAEMGEVDIPDVGVTIFNLFLGFVYTDDVTVDSDNVRHLLYLAKKYSTGKLEDVCLAFLETSLTAENVCTILEQANFFNEDEIHNKSMTYILENGKSTLESPDFLNLSQKSVLDVVKSDDLQADEKEVFQAAFEWAKHQCEQKHVAINTETLRTQLGDIVQQIRFHLLDREFFAQTVHPSGMLTDKEQLVFHNHDTCKTLPVAPFSDKPRNIKNKVSDSFVCQSCGNTNQHNSWKCNHCNVCRYCGNALKQNYRSYQRVCRDLSSCPYCEQY